MKDSRRFSVSTETISAGVVSRRSRLLRCALLAAQPSVWMAVVVGVTAGPSLRAQSFVQNPSFELNFNEVWPHYGDIDLWVSVGGGGVNHADGPFHNTGTPVTDRDRIAFKQGSGSLSQTIVGLDAGEQYWIQFFYDARACCGGTIDSINVKWNDETLDSIPNVVPTGGPPYRLRNVPFTPDSDTGTLTLEVVIVGDATALFDAVSIVQRDDGNVVIANPSFEASGPPTADIGFPPAVHSGELFTDPAEEVPANLAGWEATGQYGISFADGTYADNGAIPDQDLVGFLQGPEASFRQSISGLVAGTMYELSFAYNAASGTSPFLEVTVDDDVGSRALLDEEVTPVGGTEPYHTKTLTFEARDTTATITFAQTENDATFLLDDVRLVGQVVEDLPLNVTPTAAELAPTQLVELQVTVPSDYLARQDIDLLFNMDHPERARIFDADFDGSLVLSFAQGGDNVESFEIEGVSTGRATLNLLNLEEYPGLVWPQSVSVEVVSSFVRNASFESSPVPAEPGYGPILAWTGGSGLNTAAGPFADNGIIPDRGQVAFLQGAETLSQEIVGLTPDANYWLQFRYNARALGVTTIDLAIRFAGAELETIEAIEAVGAAPGDLPYHSASIPFSPADSSGLLEFVTTVEPNVDATLLLDAVSIVEREPGEVVIHNPSFEASGSPSGVGYAGPISGWEISGGSGINIGNPPLGPFTDNGVSPDQDRVLLLQGASRLSQIISLEPDEEYTLTYSINRRICCGDAGLFHSVSFADELLLIDEEILPAGDINPYLEKSLTFEALDVEGELVFMTSVLGDATLLIDDIHIRPVDGVREICANGVDDDGDGDIDCADSDCAAAPVCQRPAFIRGDCNSDSSINISDAGCILTWLFAQGADPRCIAATNTNGDGSTNLTDATYLLNHLFSSGPAPVEPFPECGPGLAPADPELGCEDPPDCQ